MTGTDLPDSFADHPLSITEIRSDRTGNGAEWTPRDALISMLREIDSGRIKPVGVVVCVMEEPEKNTCKAHFRNATRNPYEALGLLERVKTAVCAA